MHAHTSQWSIPYVFLVLQVIGSSVVLHDHMEFLNNSAVDGAALYLESFAQIRLADGLQMLFSGNVGRYFLYNNESNYMQYKL